MYRSHESAEARRFGASLVLAGVAATAYHVVPKGRIRAALRKLDHWTISLATTSMLHAMCPTMAGVRNLLYLLTHLDSFVITSHVLNGLRTLYGS